MIVEIDQESGFCFGVLSAIGKAEEELKHEDSGDGFRDYKVATGRSLAIMRTWLKTHIHC